MNNQTTELLKQLAQKLGTTTEYLWKVLCKQAIVNGVTELIQIVIIVIFVTFIWKLHVKFAKPYKELNHSWYCECDELLIVPMVIAAILSFILILVAFFKIDNVFNSFFNPEYWALNEVINSIKN